MSGSLWTEKGREDVIGTRDERAAIFDHLLKATLERQAISPAKTAMFNIDVARDMGKHKAALLEAETPADLWYALNLLSNTRHDRHLRVEPVEGGLPVPQELLDRQLRNYADLSVCLAPTANVELSTDFSSEVPHIFLAEVGADTILPEGLTPGAKLLAVNGEPIDDYVRRVEPYHSYSTPNFFWYHLPKYIVRQSSELPHVAANLVLTFAGSSENHTLEFRYNSAPFRTTVNARFTGWTLLVERPSFRLYTDQTEQILSLEWLGFGTSLCADVDALVAYCSNAGLLAKPLIFDASICRGGDYGGYLLQVLAKRSFRINFGDLRPSDLLPSIVEEVLAEDATALASGRLNAGQMEAITWRKDWLTNEVLTSAKTGLPAPAVPFKCAHQPKTGDGVLEPAAEHFTGPMVLITMPFGGSHIDQVAAQIVDNGMAEAHIGMPLGGFSKTWVGTEILRLPSGRPLVKFEWSCGNTIRPNGEVLESNPAMPDIPLPQTAQNFHHHHSLLLARARSVLAEAGQRI